MSAFSKCWHEKQNHCIKSEIFCQRDFFLTLQKFKTINIKLEKNPYNKAKTCLVHISRNFKDIFKDTCFNFYDCNWTRTQNHLVRKQTLKHLAKPAKWLSCILSNYLYSAFNCSSCHFTYAFQSESTLYSCLDVKELLALSRHEIWRLSDCNWTRTRNHLVHKGTLNPLAKLAKWLSCVPSTYL